MWILTQETARIVELAHCSKEFKNSYIDSSVISVCTDNDPCWIRVPGVTFNNRQIEHFPFQIMK